MQIWLIRHGLPMRIERDRGPADPRLSPTGVAQAEAVGRWLSLQSIDIVYSSPLRRAVETAEPLARTLELDVAIEPAVAEFDVNAASYVPLEELKTEDYERWKAFVDGGYGDMADMQRFKQRVAAGIEGLVRAHPGQRVAVFCHAGVVNMWASHVLGLDPQLFLNAGYASISKFLCASSGERSVSSLNETQHLATIR